MDEEGRVTEWNRQAEHIFGWQRAEAVGRLLGELIIPARHKEAHCQGLSTFLTTGEGPVLNKQVELPALNRQGHEFPVEITIWPLRMRRGWTFNAFVRDVTERQLAEAALRSERALLARRVEERTADLSAANAALAKASRLKDEFLASMSHELRTPLNAILGLSEALQEQVYGPLSDRQAQSLRTIEDSGRHLLTLINDILDLSKIEAGKTVLEIVPVSVVAVCQASLRMVKQTAHHKQLEVSSALTNGWQRFRPTNAASSRSWSTC